jgi:hypothetical protein
MTGHQPFPRQDWWRVIAMASLEPPHRRISHVCFHRRPDGVTGPALETRQERRTV